MERGALGMNDDHAEICLAFWVVDLVNPLFDALMLVAKGWRFATIRAIFRGYHLATP